MSSTKDDLPGKIRDQKDLIGDGLTDEIEALEEFADQEERSKAPHGRPPGPAEEAGPAPETL